MKSFGMIFSKIKLPCLAGALLTIVLLATLDVFKSILLKIETTQQLNIIRQRSDTHLILVNVYEDCKLQPFKTRDECLIVVKQSAEIRGIDQQIATNALQDIIALSDSLEKIQ